MGAAPQSCNDEWTLSENIILARATLDQLAHEPVLRWMRKGRAGLHKFTRTVTKVFPNLRRAQGEGLAT
jgi:hypothetical protein